MHKTWEIYKVAYSFDSIDLLFTRLEKTTYTSAPGF